MRNFSLYTSANIIKVIKSRRLRWVGHVAKLEETWRAFKMLTHKPAGKRSLGTPGRTWEDTIRIDLKKIDVFTRNWINSAEASLREFNIELLSSISSSRSS